MKNSFYPLLPLVQAIHYIRYIERKTLLCQTQTRHFLQLHPDSNLNGSQEKPNKSAYQSLSLMMFWRSPDASTAIQPLRLKLSNLLNHWSNNKKPLKLLSTVEGQPLPQLKALGAIQMLDNCIKPVNRTVVPLHILGGV